MNNLEAAGRLVLWAIELSEFDVQYQPKTTIKAQALVDFIAKFIAKDDEEGRPVTWMIWIYGSSNQRAEGARMLL